MLNSFVFFKIGIIFCYFVLSIKSESNRFYYFLIISIKNLHLQQVNEHYQN